MTESTISAKIVSQCETGQSAVKSALLKVPFAAAVKSPLAATDLCLKVLV